MPDTLEAPASAAPTTTAPLAEATIPEVAVSGLPRSATPARPAKPGSARAKMEADLDKVAGLQPKESPASTPRPGKEAGTPQGAPESRSPTTDEGAPPPEQQPPNGEQPAAPAAQPADKKVSPWKLVDQFKSRAATVEAENLTLKNELEVLRKSTIKPEQVQALQKQVQDMTDDLRYFNGSKYDPEVKAAWTAYETAWKGAMSELREITYTDPQTHQAHPITAEMLLDLVNMPLGQARDYADQIFGKFAPDVMSHRTEIKRLFEAHNTKLEELKKNGATRDQQRQQNLQNQMKALNESVQKDYSEANSSAEADPVHGEYFKPREGDKEWNDALEAGTKLVDQAYSENALDPRLTPEQRKAIIQRHAAVRNRARAFGPMRKLLARTQKELAAARKELEGYKKSSPAAGGRTVTAAGARPMRAMDAMYADLEKLAKPS